MGVGMKQILLISFVLLVQYSSVIAGLEDNTTQRLITAPLKDTIGSVIDGNSLGEVFNTDTTTDELDEKKGGNSKVSVTTVALFTLAMAAATGLGALPFFFVELDTQWAGICNGMAAGVMLAASFDLIQEGRDHGSGSWVVMGILTGGIFILLCKKFLEHYGDVSMLDIKGADATKVILVIGIMTLHSFGEGSGVGVSFAGSKGLSQGLLITLAIAVHNIPEGLAVSMVLASRGVSPQNAMLWSVITSLPQDEVARESLACIFSYINHLIKFKDKHSMDGFSSAKHHKLPNILTQKFNDMFANTESKRLADDKRDLLISYVLVLTLFADNFKTEFSDIAKDLRMSTGALRPHFEFLGCKFVRENNIMLATLPAPLKFPEVRLRRRR